ncbi:MAG: vWA domain-containing protein [Candidatus Eiseniibacteriota bacterium]
MRFRYGKWKGGPFDDPEFLKALLNLYHQLLLQMNGNVDRALEALEEIGEQYGFFNDKFSIDDFKKWLEQNEAIREVEPGRHVLTSRGERAIRRDSLMEIFGSLRKSATGDHRVPQAGSGVDRLSETRPFEFGDSTTDLDAIATIGNAIRRRGADEIEIGEEDLEVYETEHLTACATVLLLDVSHSMILYGEDRITPAKRVALALTELITHRYPKDELYVVLFGDDAREVPLHKLPYVGVGPYHTNTKAGLRLAQQILSRRKVANRQIVMITDGKPSCIWDGGRLYKNPFGLDPKIVNRTLDEATSCRRKDITITTFMVTDDPQLQQFVEKFTQLNRGRAYFADLENLGSYVLKDFVRNRRKRVR